MLIDSIQPQRLAHYFTTLCEIDSPSLQEKPVADYLRQFFSTFPQVTIEEDHSSLYTHSNSNNLIITLPGEKKASGLFFSCHMDVISPCCGVEVDVQGGVFRSKGDTVLGSDDKAGIAILMELSHCILDSLADYPLVQFIFTTGEEIGLLGAVHLDYDLIRVPYGYALDSTGVDNCIIGAPAAVYIDATITGKAAHAGLNPQDGINAIVLCGEVTSHLSLGQIDVDTTANIGLIQGGVATNIIPETVRVRGEIRSHDAEKLTQTIDIFKRTFENICGSYGGHAEISFPPQYPAMLLPHDSDVVQRVVTAACQLERTLEFIVAGGGSDANIFNSKGLPTCILGIGMADVHSTAENISLVDMQRTVELVLSIVSC